MTEDVVCRKGRCAYKNDRLNKEWADDCADCDLIERIEHDLEKQKIGTGKRN